MKHWLIIILLLVGNLIPAFAQTSLIEKQTNSFLLSPSYKKQPQKKRLWLMSATMVAGATTSLIWLNKEWYDKYDKTGFHFFNDAREWKQMDKAGHAFSAYNTTRLASELWQWAGLSKQKAVWAGSISSYSFMTAIEFLDAHSAKWGWSWADLGANTFGTALYALQENGWKEQRIRLKFSYHTKHYDPSLKDRAAELFGKDVPSQILKDYNGETQWISTNLKAFFPRKRFPSWLNVAVGYGAEGLFGGFANVAYDKNGTIRFNRPDIKRYRQWYLSPDIDLSRIKTNNKFLKTTFSVVNLLKIPAPTLEFSNGKWKGHLLYF